MKSTQELIQDLFKSHSQAVGGHVWELTPFQRLVLFFAGLIALGTLLLMLPWSWPQGQTHHFVDVLFTATSAVCVTGLIVLDTAQDFTPFGQIVIMGLIQIGGLGYMVLSSAAAILLGKHLSMHERATIKQAMNLDTSEGMGQFLRRVLLFTFCLEALGAILIAYSYGSKFSLGRALALGIFHSIAAFNNAGFSLFSDNLAGIGRMPLAVCTVAGLTIIGGLGFFVLNEILDMIRGEHKRFSLHAKLVLVTTLGLIFLGAGGLYLTANMEWGQAFFLSISSRTAGFNIQDTGALPIASLLLVTFLMFIGASPGGTGGGIKTTTLALVLLALWSTLRGRENVVVFKRSIGPETFFQALMITATMGLVMIAITFFLVVWEKFDVVSVLFEVASALGTVGLSVGDGGNLNFSALFSLPGKIAIILAMFIGRLGPLTLGLAAIFTVQHPTVQYPEGRVSIG